MMVIVTVIMVEFISSSHQLYLMMIVSWFQLSKKYSLSVFFFPSSDCTLQSRSFYTVDLFTQSIFLHSRPFYTVDLSTQSTFLHSRPFFIVSCGHKKKNHYVQKHSNFHSDLQLHKSCE